MEALLSKDCGPHRGYGTFAIGLLTAEIQCMSSKTPPSQTFNMISRITLGTPSKHPVRYRMKQRRGDLLPHVFHNNPASETPILYS